MSAVHDLVNLDSTITIEPLHLSVTQTYSNGNSSNLHLVEDGDLAIGDHAGRILKPATDGRLVIAMSVDDDHDEIHYGVSDDVDVTETLRRGIELLALALEATQRVVRR